MKFEILFQLMEHNIGNFNMRSITLYKFQLSAIFIFISILVISCKVPVEEFNNKCSLKPASYIWGQWKEHSFQKKLKDYINFEKNWTFSTNQHPFLINACTDVTPEQWIKGAGCCGFLYYNLKNDSLFAGGFVGSGSDCSNIYCLTQNTILKIEKLTPDSLTIINDYGRYMYLKIK